MASLSSPHFVIFPFMSKGHTIPILHLVRRLLLLHLRRNISVTIFTTHANSLFVRHSLAGTKASVIDLSFPQNDIHPQLPPGVESTTDKLTSMSLLISFVTATKLMQPEFDRVVANLQPSVSCIISDAFFPWTQQSASKLGVPRLLFNGMSNYAMIVPYVTIRDRPYVGLDSDDEPFTVPAFPWIKLTKNDFLENYLNPEPGPQTEFFLEQATARANSKGIIVNSFYELETKCVDYSDEERPPKAWCVGPLCLAAEPPKIVVQPCCPQKKKKPLIWTRWLDEMLGKGRSVLYVAFGSQAELTTGQLQEIAVGLEKSESNFLWVVRSKGAELINGFEERVKGRGLVVREWVEQEEILRHESVDGFMSHCGWNSVLESICASVPILAWPMMAEQHLNARLVVEELGIGVRVLARNGSVRGFVGSECIEKKVRELMEGEKGKEVRKKVKEVGEAARKAMEEGGSSWRTLELLMDEVCGKK